MVGEDDRDATRDLKRSKLEGRAFRVQQRILATDPLARTSGLYGRWCPLRRDVTSPTRERVGHPQHQGPAPPESVGPPGSSLLAQDPALGERGMVDHGAAIGREEDVDRAVGACKAVG